MISKKVLISEFVFTLRSTIKLMHGCNDIHARKRFYDHCYYSTCCMLNIGLISVDKFFFLCDILNREFGFE